MGIDDHVYLWIIYTRTPEGRLDQKYYGYTEVTEEAYNALLDEEIREYITRIAKRIAGPDVDGEPEIRELTGPVEKMLYFSNRWYCRICLRVL